MRRRDFVNALLVTGALAWRPACQLRRLASGADPDAVTQVLVLFKCHLDVGFTDTQAAVMRKYFDEYFPQAMKMAAAMRQSGSDRYTWTTGSWIFYEYLEQASPGERRLVEQA